MNEKMKTLQLKEFNTDYVVTLIYDKCKSGESQYGPWNLYGVEYQGEQQGVFADESLHQQLQQYGKGSKLIIRRNQVNDGKVEWLVTPANGGTQRKYNHNHLDDRTRDIHRQVALKIATISIGQTTKPWTAEDLQEIRVRMDRLLGILDGNTYNDLPF